MKKSLIPLVLALFVSLTGCAATEGGAASSAPSGSNRPTASSTSEPESAPEDDTLTFGEAFTYEDGLSVEISKPKKFTPSDTASSAFEKKQPKGFLAFQVTVVNGTDEPYDATLFSATLQAGNQEAEQVFDSANGYEGAPSTKVLKGRETTFEIAFGVSQTKDLVMDVAPGFLYDSALFQDR